MKINSLSNNYSLNSLSQKRSNSKHSAISVKMNTPTFSGAAPLPLIDGLSKLYTNVAKTKPFQKLITAFSKSDKSFTHLMVIDSAVLSTFYTVNALRNKKIKKEQKPQMVINDALTLGVSAAGSYLLDGKITKAVDKFTDSYFMKHADFYKDMDKTLIDKTKGGINKIKTLVIFGMIYRYLGPVLITPLANKISSKFFEGKKEQPTQVTK